MSLADPFRAPEASELLAALGYGSPPDAQGWLARDQGTIGRFDDHFAPILIRLLGEKAQLRVAPEMRHTNMNGVVHGAFLLALIDYSLFAGPVAMGLERVLGGATIETSTQFYAPVTADAPIDVIIEVMRQTGRLVFLRGVIEQNGVAAVGFSGTIRRRNEREAAERLAQHRQLRNSAER